MRVGSGGRCVPMGDGDIWGPNGGRREWQQWVYISGHITCIERCVVVIPSMVEIESEAGGRVVWLLRAR